MSTKIIDFETALKLVKNKYPSHTFTGYAYQYENDYYIELGPKGYDPNKDGGVVDGMVFVAGNGKKIKPYNPFIDGFHNALKIKIIK